MSTPYIVDLSHWDVPPDAAQDVDLHAMAGAGIVGVILKATQGSADVDPAFAGLLQRALEVWPANCVHAYHFLDGSDPRAQIDHFLATTPGIGFRWLDYEQNPPSQCSLEDAVKACHDLQTKQGVYPGMYGSDEDLLGAAIDAGHFAGVCPMWLAKYGDTQPGHAWNLWQYSQYGNLPKNNGGNLDLDTFGGDGAACQAWFGGLAFPNPA